MVNCGEYVGEYTAPTPNSKESLLKSLACAEDSAKRHKPSRIVVHRQGKDSLLAEGVLSDATGRAFFFQYDSAPCGTPTTCAEWFDLKLRRVSDVEDFGRCAGLLPLGIKAVTHVMRMSERLIARFSEWRLRVPGAGIEPARPYGHGILSPERLPVPPPRLV